MSDLCLYGKTLTSRLLMGTARFSSLALLLESIDAAGSEIVTLGLRRSAPQHGGGNVLWRTLQEKSLCLLPNTAGCYNADEAVNTALMARELFASSWIKLEVVKDDHTLEPDADGLVLAAERLSKLDFKVFPYCTEDCVLAQRLLDAGCEVLMPWGSPIGSGRGLLYPDKLKKMRDTFPDIPLIVDAGLGAPSHVAQAMELGFDAVLINTAIARAINPPQMAAAMRDAQQAGMRAYEAGIITPQKQAQPSTAVIGKPFWHQLLI